jgi:hypothetical protein
MLSIEKPLYRVWKFDGENTFVLDYETSNWDDAKEESYALYAQGYEVLMNEQDKPTTVHVKTNSATCGFALGPEFIAHSMNEARIVDASFFEQFKLDASGYFEKVTQELNTLAKNLDSMEIARGHVSALDDPAYQEQLQSLRKLTDAINSGVLLVTGEHAIGQNAHG